jgi:aryl-alcohol dehydrogenase-like predicted oxidoreductase
VALAWLLRNPVVSTAIVGAATREELRLDLGAPSVQLDAEVAERLDWIWPVTLRTAAATAGAGR